MTSGMMSINSWIFCRSVLKNASKWIRHNQNKLKETVSNFDSISSLFSDIRKKLSESELKIVDHQLSMVSSEVSET
jgi:hypothetical protein